MPCPTLQRVADFLESLAPPQLAADWDNVGILVGWADCEVRRIMTCLTVTPATTAEAVRRRADLIVAHHPLPFHPLRQITSATTAGRMLLDLIAAGVGVYSAHTAFDSAPAGINQLLAETLGLHAIEPLTPQDEGGGDGRHGRFPQPLTLDAAAQCVRERLHLGEMMVVGPADQGIERLAIGCGAAGEFIERACSLGCDAMLLGEARFHDCLEAESRGLGLLLIGHYASERFAMERLADRLTAEFSDCEVWASVDERDPLRWIG